eukprot:maker-scaffold1754_size28903-snap-gene-0.7 protein:Tk09274 transcript:maker-scaffold1754_size28903-snap-gene-0.7-mRNA-1 annotation:"rho gtpase-activating protein 11a isoform 1"
MDSHTLSMAWLPEHDLEAVHDLIRHHLRQEYGLHVSSKRHPRGRGPSAVSAAAFLSRTPGKAVKHAAGLAGLGGLFGRPLRDLSMKSVAPPTDSEGETLVAPDIATLLCARLEDTPDWLETEGVFRKSGSTLRQKELRAALELGQAQALAEAQVLDVAALLKLWLRELPEPLVPYHLHKTVIESTRLGVGAMKEALMLLSCLMPQHHLSTLKFLCTFFHRVAQKSHLNKMDLANLAIVLTPTLFPLDDHGKHGKGTAKHDDHLGSKTRAVECLFRHAAELGVLAGPTAQAYREVMDLHIGPSDENLETDTEAAAVGGLGPMARRRRKLKRRSGSLSRVLTATMRGIQKAVYRSTSTPGSVRKRGEESYHCTPLPQSLRKGFVSPRLPLKRKADKAHEASPPKSKSKRGPLDAVYTPKLTSRPFSVKKFKRKKSLKESGLAPNSTNYSPLPNKPSIVMNTPRSPQCVADIAAPKDLDQSLERGMVNASMTTETDVSSTCSQWEPRKLMLDESNSSTDQARAGRAQSKTQIDTPDASQPGRGRRRRSRSPSERKIGQIRRRSHEAAMKQQLAAKPQGAPSSAYFNSKDATRDLNVKPNMTNLEAHDMRAQLKIGRHYAQRKPGATSPVRGEHGGLRSKSLAAMRSKESLSGLRKDINSFIEKSFSADISGISKLDADDVGSVNDTFDEEIAVSNLVLEPQPVSVAQRRDTLLRRQSSAFEFSRGRSTSKLVVPCHDLRRQSSAFEIARNFESLKEPVYENFKKMPTRSSLRRKNSSVKDLVKKIETSAVKAPPAKEESAKSNESRSSWDDEFESNPTEEWVDAQEFFKNPSSCRVDLFPIEDGCKRSSIIKIRNENRGLVSKTKATFTKPEVPPRAKLPLPVGAPATPGNQSVQPSNSRRLSARMGVSTALATPQKGSSSGHFSTSASRRQTLTGIRTSVKFKPVPASPFADSKSNRSTPQPPNRPPQVPPRIRTTPATRRTPHRQPPQSPFISSQPKGLDRKARRHDEKRHLTIGYSGEVRSPLRERQNIVPTVQRSKSAQTPLQRKVVHQIIGDPNLAAQEHPMVRRSQSMHGHEGDEENFLSPTSETRTRTPKSSVKRHHSERTHHAKKRETPRSTTKGIHSAFTPNRGYQTIVKI